MKIGLISYHNEPNYGTMLQAFALSKALAKLGVESEYLQYFSFKQRSFVFKAFRNIIRTFIPAPPSQFDYFKGEEFVTTLEAFNNFHKDNIPTSDKEYYFDTVKEANCRYDKFIVGSDQTWSEYMNRSGSTANFLNFVTDNFKKNSYAPSIGTLSITEEYAEVLKQHLHSFNHLSCREKQNSKRLSEIIGKRVEYVIDPTLLLTPKEWNQIAFTPVLPYKGYILAYILGEKDCIANYAEELGLKTGLPVYYILTRPKYLSKTKCLKGVGPAEFVGLIRDASYVVTDSFHGTAFCLNYGTLVYSFTKRTVTLSESALDNDRIKLLLAEFNLQNRAKDDKDTSFEDDYDPQTYQKHLDDLRNSSWNYLKSIVNK